MLRHFDWNNFQSPGQPFPCVDKADREYIMGYFRIIAGVFPLLSRHLNGVIFLSGCMNIEYCAVVRGVCRSPDLLGGGLLLLQCLSTGCKTVPEVVTGSFFQPGHLLLAMCTGHPRRSLSLPLAPRPQNPTLKNVHMTPRRSEIRDVSRQVRVATCNV